MLCLSRHIRGALSFELSCSGPCKQCSAAISGESHLSFWGFWGCFHCCYLHTAHSPTLQHPACTLPAPLWLPQLQCWQAHLAANTLPSFVARAWLGVVAYTVQVSQLHLETSCLILQLNMQLVLGSCCLLGSGHPWRAYIRTNFVSQHACNTDNL